MSMLHPRGPLALLQRKDDPPGNRVPRVLRGGTPWLLIVSHLWFDRLGLRSQVSSDATSHKVQATISCGFPQLIDVFSCPVWKHLEPVTGVQDSVAAPAISTLPAAPTAAAPTMAREARDSEVPNSRCPFGLTTSDHYEILRIIA